MNEVLSIPVGFLVCDTMLKAADVTLVAAGCVCAGKYYAAVTGEVAAVRSSVEAGKAAAGGALVDCLVIPNVDAQVAPAIMACSDIKDIGAVGIMIVLRSPKGWTGPEAVDGEPVEGTFRAHQVPVVSDTPDHRQIVEDWLRSYRPEELFDDKGTPVQALLDLPPVGAARM